jgi:hypothetical protein
MQFFYFDGLKTKKKVLDDLMYIIDMMRITL